MKIARNMIIQVCMRLTLISILLFSVQAAHSQTNWRALASAAYGNIESEINDSIANLRSRSDVIRENMTEIVVAKDLKKIMIFGKNDVMIREGMHERFNKAPSPMQVDANRDGEIVRLENLHVQLYHADKRLSHWLNMQQRLKSHPDKLRFTRWMTRWNDLPSEKRSISGTDADKQFWIEGSLVCYLIQNNIYPSSKASIRKLKNFDPEISDELRPVADSYPPKSKFPVPGNSILVSYPLNGQYAFDISESLPGVGYVIYPVTMRGQMSALLNQGHMLRARWVSATGSTSYTLAEYRYMTEAIFFRFPDELTPEMVYRLEIVTVPSTRSTPSPSERDCWDVFRGVSASDMRFMKEMIPGETQITELYFRTSKFRVRQKLAAMKGTLLYDIGAVAYRTEEPIDPLELNGNGIVPGQVTFDIQHTFYFAVNEALNSKELYYYLTVPKTQPLSDLPLSELVVAESDNTIAAPFVRNTSLGNPRAFPGLPDDREHDIKLSGDYIAPKYKRFNLKDSLVTSTPVPFITKEYFDKGGSMPLQPMQCTLYVGEFKQLVALASLQQKQITQRMEERATFFYELDLRQSQREGMTFQRTLDDYRKLEKDNLPKSVSIIMNAKFPDIFESKFTILYSKRFPGTKQYSSHLQVDFGTEQ